MHRLRSVFTWVGLATLLVAASASPLFADDLIPVQPLTRKFPQGQFCALPVTLQFITPTTGVIVNIEAQVFVDDQGTLKWTNQSIDNVTLATSAVVAANFFPPPAGSNSQFCYNDPPPVSYFYFNEPGLVMPYRQLFDDPLSVIGWDLSNGAYYNASESAPRNPEVAPPDPEDDSGGSLGLGEDSPTPSLATIARTSLTVDGLDIGVSYDLGAWWQANFVKFPHDVTYLSIGVTTLDGTPIARRSWGSIKSTYR